MTSSRNAKRNSTIYMDYHGINEAHQRVPAIVLASRYGLCRARVYQIVSKEQSRREAANPRMVFRTANIEEDAKVVASMLGEMLGAL